MTRTPHPHDGPLVCPECGEPVLPRAPSSWQPALGPAPAHSHLDGQPLCPVVGPHGYQPAYPVRRPPAPTARPGAADTDESDES